MARPEFDTDLRGPGLLASLWRYRLLVAGVTLAALAIGYFLALNQPTVYTATARLLLREDTSVFVDVIRPGEDPTRLPEQVEVLLSRSVMERAAEALDDGTTPDTIRDKTSAGASSDLDIIDVTATDGSAQRAADIANAVVDGYLEQTAENAQERADAALEVLEQRQAELEERIDELSAVLEDNPDDFGARAGIGLANRQRGNLATTAERIAVDASLQGDSAELFSPAVAPRQPSRQNPISAAALLGVFGFILAAVIAWWRAGKVGSANASEDVAAVLGVPLLGEIPTMRQIKSGQLPALADLPPANVESYRFVLASIEFFLAKSGGNSLVLTSADPGDGKTLTSLNLSLAAAREGRRIVLIDADERARGLTRRINALGDRGLTDLGREASSLEASSLPLGNNARSPVRFVPIGQRQVDPAGYFRTPEFQRAIAQVKEEADLVVIDTPPILAVAETSAIAGRADGVVLVVTRGTRVGRLEEIRERMEFIGTPLLGYVFNRSRARSRHAYAYGYTEPTKPAKPARSPAPQPISTSSDR